MADISIGPPAHVGHYVWQQMYDKSCGAVCLLCAALETGHTVYGSIGAHKEHTLRLNFESEAALYYITSGAEAKGQTVTSLINIGEYSMPSNIVRAAKHIGFTNATIYMQSTLPDLLLKACYAEEVKICKHMSGVKVVKGYKASSLLRSDLGVGEYKLVVVLPYGIGLHYVLHRPDGSYMDPASGKDLSSMPGHYVRTGLSIVLS